MKYDVQVAEHINPYLIDAQDVIVTAREHPICNVPEMNKGSQPTDGGFLLLNETEKEEIIKESPIARKWIRPFIGVEEILIGKKRWCLWLVGVPPSELRKCKPVMERVNNVRKLRLKSKASSTRKAVNMPTLFTGIRQPNVGYLLVPRVSSENRKYAPMGIMDKNNIASDSTIVIPDANLHELGILSSIIHMVWVRAVAGRLKSDYRYSKDIVYNNFIWPNPTKSQKEAIEKAAQAVLDARKLYPDSTLADLYDSNTMPPELVKVHEKLDNAVKSAYGNEGFDTEEEVVASLMKLYKEVLDKENTGKKSI